MFSSTFADIKYGPMTPLKLGSNAYQYSFYYTQPIVRKPGFELLLFDIVDGDNKQYSQPYLFEAVEINNSVFHIHLPAILFFVQAFFLFHEDIL